MEVFRRYMNNPLRNFNYLIGCEETRQAIALDPLDGDAMVALAEEQGYTIKYIINTSLFTFIKLFYFYLIFHTLF